MLIAVSTLFNFQSANIKPTIIEPATVEGSHWSLFEELHHDAATRTVNAAPLAINLEAIVSSGEESLTKKFSSPLDVIEREYQQFRADYHAMSVAGIYVDYLAMLRERRELLRTKLEKMRCSAEDGQTIIIDHYLRSLSLHFRNKRFSLADEVRLASNEAIQWKASYPLIYDVSSFIGSLGFALLGVTQLKKHIALGTTSKDTILKDDTTVNIDLSEETRTFWYAVVVNYFAAGKSLDDTVALLQSVINNDTSNASNDKPSLDIPRYVDYVKEKMFLCLEQNLMIQCKEGQLCSAGSGEALTIQKVATLYCCNVQTDTSSDEHRIFKVASEYLVENNHLSFEDTEPTEIYAMSGDVFMNENNGNNLPSRSFLSRSLVSITKSRSHGYVSRFLPLAIMVLGAYNLYVAKHNYMTDSVEVVVDELTLSDRSRIIQSSGSEITFQMSIEQNYKDAKITVLWEPSTAPKYIASDPAPWFQFEQAEQNGEAFHYKLGKDLANHKLEIKLDNGKRLHCNAHSQGSVQLPNGVHVESVGVYKQTPDGVVFISGIQL